MPCDGKERKMSPEKAQRISDDPRIGQEVTLEAHPHATFKVLEVWRWSDGWERFHVELVDGVGPVECSAPATDFTLVD
jgi:hypothetical protein